MVHHSTQKDDQNKKRSIKCVVWDLDNTLWDGILLEDDTVTLKEQVAHIIRTLDERGILQSIASRNDSDRALESLKGFGIQEYFLYPRIDWGSKVPFIETIAQSLNIGLDSLAFIDDQEFEREEVRFSLPEVLLIDAAHVDRVLDMPEMNPRFITEDSTLRRQMYLNDIERNRTELVFIGPKESFLSSLNMEITLFPAQKEDLMRAEELTLRTHQLNSTGYTYSFEKLDFFRRSDSHILLMAKLEDKFGSYGHIGLALVECQKTTWTIKLLLMSCRVMSRGVGVILLIHIMHMAKKKKVRLLAEYLPNERNRMMNITYRFAQFEAVETHDKVILFKNNLNEIPPIPDYISVTVE